MTNPDTRALQALADKVEAGEALNGYFDDAFGINPTGTNAIGAYHGSLDAAKALHDAVLPDRAWGITCGGEYGSVATVTDLDNGPHRCQSFDPARAWLLAILRALIAGGRDGQA